MTFGEKLAELRGEKGLSQAGLAGKLKVSQQIIHTWEQGQAYPDAQQLLVIANFFNVSLDYLMKENVNDHSSETEKGYFVSREFAADYLLTIKRASKFWGISITLYALAFLPYFILDKDPALFVIPTIILIIFGFVIMAKAISIEGKKYDVLEEEQLMFDDDHLEELKMTHEDLDKRHGAIVIIGTLLLIIVIIMLVVETFFMETEFLTPHTPTIILGIAISIYFIMPRSLVLESHRRLAKNEEYTPKKKRRK